MTTISAKMICHSVSEQDIQLPTLQLRYPKCIHGEFMTHRVFSRNASSSRAIPVERLIKDVIDDPYVPVHWGRNQKGMQAFEENPAPIVHPEFGYNWKNEEAWLKARDEMIVYAQ